MHVCDMLSTGTYGDTGVNTFNVTMVGDFMSGTGYYANWSDDGKIVGLLK